MMRSPNLCFHMQLPALSAAPLLCTLADPVLLQKLMSLPVHVVLKGAAGRGADVCCVSCMEDAPIS